MPNAQVAVVGPPPNLPNPAQPPQSSIGNPENCPPGDALCTLTGGYVQSNPVAGLPSSVGQFVTGGSGSVTDAINATVGQAGLVLLGVLLVAIGAWLAAGSPKPEVIPIPA